MLLSDIELILFWFNIILEVISLTFISFVFFDLLYVDQKVHLTQLSETYEKFKRYDIFKTSLIFLVLNLYFSFLAKLTYYLNFHSMIFTFLSFIGNLFLIIFTFDLYKLVHSYVPKVKKE